MLKLDMYYCLTEKVDEIMEYLPSTTINKKISLWNGDITRLEIDAIVNSTTPFRSSTVAIGPRATVHNTLHEAAGYFLIEECVTLKKCTPGAAMVTFGYNLPAKCKPSLI